MFLFQRKTFLYSFCFFFFTIFFLVLYPQLLNNDSTENQSLRYNKYWFKIYTYFFMTSFPFSRLTFQRFSDSLLVKSFLKPIRCLLIRTHNHSNLLTHTNFFLYKSRSKNRNGIYFFRKFGIFDQIKNVYVFCRSDLAEPTLKSVLKSDHIYMKNKRL